MRDRKTVYGSIALTSARWAVYPKGTGVAFGDSEIRSLLRALGFRDSKSCSVSERLTATRYGLATVA
jgi:hypothetical protein